MEQNQSSISTFAAQVSSMYECIVHLDLIGSIVELRDGRNVSPLSKSLSLQMSNPLGQHGTGQEQGGSQRERGVGAGGRGGYSYSVLKVPWPINRLFEFPP